MSSYCEAALQYMRAKDALQDVSGRMPETDVYRLAEHKCLYFVACFPEKVVLYVS